MLLLLNLQLGHQQIDLWQAAALIKGKIFKKLLNYELFLKIMGRNKSNLF